MQNNEQMNCCQSINVMSRAERIKHSNQCAKKNIEKKGYRLVSKETFSELCPEIASWLAPLFTHQSHKLPKYGRSDILLLYKGGEVEQGKVKLYTTNFEYTISFTLPKDNNGGYLGCILSCRKHECGETVTRGCDLHDGKYTKDTFLGIMYDIIKHEMEPIKLWIPELSEENCNCGENEGCTSCEL